MNAQVMLHEREPAWDVALLFPRQGEWSVEDYLALDTNRPVEYSHGSIEVLEMPTARHQRILAFLYRLLFDFATARRLGSVILAAFPIRLSPEKYREPDVALMLAAHASRMGEACWDGADLVIEILSSNRQHDLVHKRREYALAGIPEYWIVDPQNDTIAVLTLQDGRYAEHGWFRRSDTLTSPLLPELRLPVSDVMDAGAAQNFAS